MRPDARLADRIDVVERGAKAYRLDDRRRPGLEFVRRFAIGDAVFVNFADHLAAAEKRRHGFEMRHLAVQNADAGWAVELMAGHHIEVAVDVLHIDIHMHGGLRAIDQHRNAARMRKLNDFLYRHDGAERIRHLRDRHHFGARAEQLLEFANEEVAVIIDRRPFDHRAETLAEEVPRDDIGMVLHDREHDLVAFPQPHAAEARRDEIDRLGGVLGEDNFFLGAGIDEGSRRLARAFVSLRRLIGEIMQAAMHIGILRRIGAGQAIENLGRLLRRGGVVEINQRLAINLHGQRRKIGADLLDVVTAIADGRVHVHARDSSQDSAAVISASRKPSWATSSMVSPMNAWISRASACLSSMPRDIR